MAPLKTDKCIITEAFVDFEQQDYENYSKINILVFKMLLELFVLHLASVYI